MQIQKANNQQSFGSAFIVFNQVFLDKLSKSANNKAIKMLTDNVHFSQFSDELFISADDASKKVQKSLFTDNISLQYTDNDPEKEFAFVKRFNKLLGGRNIIAGIIDNTPENTEKIGKAAHLQQSIVIGAGLDKVKELVNLFA